MIIISNRSRPGVAAAVALVAACLLTIPRSTDERSAPKAPGAAPAALAAAARPSAQKIGPGVVAAGPTAATPAAALDRPATTQQPGMAGMVVGIDPETGKVGMPSPEQMKLLSASASYQIDHSAAGLVEVHHPDGSVSVDLQGRFQEYETVRIGPDGKKVFQCVDGAENAKRTLESPPPPAAEER